MYQHENGLFTTNLLEKIREKFLYVDWDPYTGQRIYFEASGGSLRLKSVLDTMARETALPDELFRYNPASDHAVAIMLKGIEDVKLFVGAKDGYIISTNSATHAMARVINAITAHVPGKNIVTTQLEHPAVLSATKYFAELRGLEWRVAPIDKESSSVPPEAILNLIDKDTSLLAFQHASNQTGAINDVKYIVQEARRIKPDLHVLVDAVQYAPHAHIDVEDLGVDAYAFGPYKAYCVKGIGFAYISERVAKLPHLKLIGKPETDWVLGSPAPQPFACWSAVIDYLCWLGNHFTSSTNRREQLIAAKKAITKHMQALLHLILNGDEDVPGLEKLNHVRVCGMKGGLNRRLCIFLFQLEGMTATEAMNRYNREFHIRLAARVRDSYSKYPLEGLGWEDAVRLSAAHYNTPEEVKAFLKATTALKI
ncbi:MAG: aminotransferase [Candidatus Aminicenantes bacterium]|nr:MAG: aminotransferase [Candidatus Aminicenantes bacterium]